MKGSPSQNTRLLFQPLGNSLPGLGRVPIEFHRNLITAEQIRLQGDYQSQGNVSPTQAQTLIDQAAKFITLAAQQIQ
ncbi:hypothetical protein [Phormidesmis priestleyi]|uniref:hypothetical protein n=1 Tax=Phormidesmis priestleyi TaxID=268141 RepID=UPI000A9FD181|nr:hypothetical protein [Phormidesmis priestleyi]